MNVLIRAFTLFLLLFNILEVVPCFASLIEEKDCKTFRKNSTFGPIRNQDNRGFCHAFAAAALFEEELCLQKKANCGKSISPLSIARWTTNIMAEDPKEDGWFLEDDLKVGIEMGVCEEKFYSYTDYLSTTNGSFKCEIDKDLDLKDQLRSMRNQFVQIYSKLCSKNTFHFSNLVINSNRYHSELSSCKNNHALIVNDMKWVNGRCVFQLRNSWGVDGDFQGEYDADTFMNAVQALNSLSKTKDTGSGNGKPILHYNEDSEVQKMNIFNNIKNQLKTGRSTIASICLDLLPRKVKGSGVDNKLQRANRRENVLRNVQCEKILKKFGKLDPSKIYNHTIDEVENAYPGLSEIMNGAVFNATDCLQNN
ncbi:MAG: C1 family peptidase [Pseudobdellovibrionaceae bacterium]